MKTAIESLIGKVKASMRLLIHASVREDSIERIRHRSFISSHLGSAVLAAAALPIYMIHMGISDYVGLLIMLGLITPAYIATFLSRTGNLAVAHLLSAINLTTLVTFTACFTGGVTSFIMAWIIVAPIESAFSGSKKVIATSLVLACAGVLLLVVAGSMGYLPASRTATQNMTLLTGLSIISVVAYISGLLVNFQILNEKAAELLHEGELQFRILAENATDMITYHNHLGAVLFSSGASSHYTKGGESELLRDGFIKLVHPDDRNLYLETFSRASVQGAPAQAEFRMKSNSASADVTAEKYIWVEMRCKPLAERAEGSVGTNGAKQLHVVAVTRDINDLKAQQDEITASRDAAEEANNAKTRFLANISHELRTPLNAIIGFSELLGDKRLNQNVTSNQSDYIKLIHQSGSHLLTVVNDLLDMSMIEVGKLQIKKTRFDLCAQITSVIKIMQITATQRGISIIDDSDGTVCEISADQRAVYQILFNLISNAIKFSHEGGDVRVTMKTSGNNVVFSVSDSGIGIPEDVIPKLCQPFVQAENTHARAYEGAGLGLSVVAGFVELHGGNLSIVSKEGEGACVAVEMPCVCKVEKQNIKPEKSPVVFRMVKADQGTRQNTLRGPVKQVI